jgi:nucleoside-diphosphate-sugar epimerase
MSTLLVIGGSGFFGKSILDAYWRGLLEPWGINKIVVMARNATETLKNYPELIQPQNRAPEKTKKLNQVVELLDSDICSCSSLPSAEYVIHAAASTDARNYLSSPQTEKENIQQGVSNFCELAKKYLKESKILYVSSGAVYGQKLGDVSNLAEDAPLLHINSLPLNKQDYAAAKRDGELLIKQLGTDGLNVIIARCFAFVGKYLPRDQHFAIGNFIEDGIKGRPIKVTARSLVYRSYMYADDLVIWLMTLANLADKSCNIFNVGSDDRISIQELAKKLASKFKVKIDCPIADNDQPEVYVPSIQKALNIGCCCPRNLDESILLSALPIAE